MSSLLHKGFLIMVNVELLLLEDKLNYWERKYGVLEEEAELVWSRYGELRKVSEDVESSEIHTRMLEREDLMNSQRGFMDRIIQLMDDIRGNIRVLRQSGGA